MATLQAPSEGDDKKKKGPKGGQNDANSDLFKIVRYDDLFLPFFLSTFLFHSFNSILYYLVIDNLHLWQLVSGPGFFSIFLYSIYRTIYYSTLFLIYSTLFYSVLFHSILFYPIFLYSTLFYSILLDSIYYSTLFHSTLFFSYSHIFYSTLLYFTLLWQYL